MGDYRIMGKILKYFSNKSHPSVSMKNFAQNIFATVRGELIFNPQHCSQERISLVKFSPPQVSGKIGEMRVFSRLKNYAVRHIDSCNNNKKPSIFLKNEMRCRVDD